jgi:Domain of unknown function (DUF1844)
MPEKKHEQQSFTVTDRRLFTADGELRGETEEKVESTKIEAPKVEPAKPTTPEATPTPEAAAPAMDEKDPAAMPPLPTPDEQQVQADAYKESSRELDTQVELSGRAAKEFEMTFERFMASLYMTAMLQLGLMREQGGQPRIDIIGARQTIDTLSLISEKTKGNLTLAEENFLQNSLYELRMAYVEVTNVLARPPQPGSHPGQKTGTGGR